MLPVARARKMLLPGSAHRFDAHETIRREPRGASSDSAQSRNGPRNQTSIGTRKPHFWPIDQERGT